MPWGDETWLQLTDKSPPPVPEQRRRPGLGGPGPRNSESLSLGSALSLSPRTSPCQLASGLSEELHFLSISGHTGSDSCWDPGMVTINHDHCGEKDKNKCFLVFELSIYRPNLSSDQHLAIIIGAGISTTDITQRLFVLHMTFSEQLSD